MTTLTEGERFYLLFPLDLHGTKSRIQCQAILLELMQKGFSRLFRAGETLELRQPEDYKFDDFDETYVLIDRLKADPSIRQRLVDSLEICFRESGAAIIEVAGRTSESVDETTRLKFFQPFCLQIRRRGL